MSIPTTYTILISEEQREALLRVLKASGEDFDSPVNDPTKGPFEHPLMFWKEMLQELPETEAQHPGISHGFCL